MDLYRQYFPQMSIRSCFFQIYPDADDDITLLSERNDPASQWPQPPPLLFQHFSSGLLLPQPLLSECIADASGILVGDSVLENESQ